MHPEIDETKLASDPATNRVLLTVSTEDRAEAPRTFALHPAMARQLSDDLLLAVARHDLAMRGQREDGGSRD